MSSFVPPTGRWFVRFVVIAVLALLVSTLGLAQGACPVAAVTVKELSLEYDLTRASVDQDKLSSDLAVVARTRGCQRLIITGLASYDEKAGIITRKQGAEVFHQSYLAGGRWFVAPGVLLLHNSSLGIRLQEIYVVRLGVGSTGASMSLGPALVRKDLATAGAVQTSAAIAAAASLSRRFRGLATGDTISLSPAVMWSEPTGGEVGRTVTMTLTLTVPITRSVGVSWRVLGESIGRPPPGFDSAYVSSATRITISF